MTEVATKPEDTADVASAPIVNPHPEGTAEYFLFDLALVRAQRRQWIATGGDIGLAPLAAQRAQQSIYADAASLGIDIAGATQKALDPIRQLLVDPNLVNHATKELEEVYQSINAAKALGAGELTVKKKWLAAIKLAITVQQLARSNPVFSTIYVIRCQESNAVLTMEKIHIEIFRQWNDPEYPNTLTEAPPGIGKTTLLYGQDLFEMARDPRLRFLRSSASLETSEKRLEVTRQYIGCKRFQALYPHIKIDAKKKNKATEFTLVRPNIGSQDPTMVAAGATSIIQGAGFDRLCFDDLCDERVRREPTTRQNIWAAFFGVALRRRRDFINSRIRYICTPWHVDDAAAKLLSAVRNGDLPGWSAKLIPVKEYGGVPIPPVDRPGYVEELQAIKKTDPLTYACCYLLNPSDESQRMLKGLVYYDVSGGNDPLCPEPQRTRYSRLLKLIENGEQWQVLDPAAGGADQTGMTGFSIGASGRAAITSSRFFRGKSTESIEEICKAVQVHGADKILIEAQGGMKGVADLWGSYIVQRVGAEYRDRILFSGTRLYTGGRPGGQNRSKSDRYFNCLPYLESGSVLFPGRWAIVDGMPKLICADGDNFHQLHDQLLNYPNVVRDDGLDCVSMFILYNSSRLVRRVKTISQPQEPVSGPPDTDCVLTQMRRAMQPGLRNRGLRQDDTRAEEMDLLKAAG